MREVVSFRCENIWFPNIFTQKLKHEYQKGKFYSFIVDKIFKSRANSSGEF